MTTKELPENMLPAIEWEALSDPRTISELEEKGKIHPAIESILLVRDDNYEIKVTLKGTNAKTGRYDPDEKLRMGENVQGSNVIGYENPYTRIIFENLFQGHTTIRGDGLIEADAMLGRAICEYQNEEKPGWFSVWCLNAPKSFLAPRVTERNSDSKLIRNRKAAGGDEKDSKVEFSFPKEGISRDHWIIKNHLFEVRLCFVPEYFGPKWSKNCSLEFPLPQDSISPNELPEDIIESVSFVLGKRLIPIGTSLYSVAGHHIKEMVTNPWGLDLKLECENPEMPPFPLSRNHNFLISEPVASQITETYYLLRDDLSFSKSMWQYWISRIVPAEGSLVYLSMAMETLMAAWFKSAESKTKGVYLAEEEFSSIAEEPFKLLGTKLAGKEYSDRIMRRARQSNNMGVNERYEFFFNEIDLPVTEFEPSVIKSRNRFAHGAIGDREEYQKLSNAIRAYQALFHRVMLKLLGYTGSYIDYSTYDFPERPLDEPLGGPEGDRKPIRF